MKYVCPVLAFPLVFQDESSIIHRREEVGGCGVVGKMQIALPNCHLQHFGDAKEELRFLQLTDLSFLTPGFEH